VNNRDPHSTDEHAVLRERGPRTARVVLIEPRTLFRRRLAHALMTFLPRMSIKGVESAEEVAPGPTKLLLIGPDPLSGCEAGGCARPSERYGGSATVRRSALICMRTTCASPPRSQRWAWSES